MTASPLILGITGHYGAGRSTVARILADDHGMTLVSMSDIIRAEGGAAASLSDLQALGDGIRCREGNDGIAKRVVKQIKVSKSRAIVVDGIKNPAEVMLLSRSGTFFLLAVQASTETRWKRVHRALSGGRSEFDAIDLRDNREIDRWGVAVGHGQRVADCLLLADAMMWNDAPEGTIDNLKSKCARFYRFMASPVPGELPTLPEIRMCQAYAIAQRSSCGQRKVGAVITNADGRVLAEGCNEPPAGQPSCRELYDTCYRGMLWHEELSGLAHLFKCPQCGGKLDANLNCECGERFAHLLPKRKHLDYCRALHAEENAILQVSRYGGVGLEGGIMFVTTYPCALCAKKIVSCGISKVVFAEAYNVPEARDFFAEAGTEVRAFEGFTQNAFQRVFNRQEDAS